MADYKRKRVDYINRWPITELFESERIYQEKCDHYIKTYNLQPFTPIKMWYDTDKDYNIAISRLIECLEEMPNKPHHAFAYAFICFDSYSEIYVNTLTDKYHITDRLKKVAERIDHLASQNSKIDDMLYKLFSAIPMQSMIFLYNEMYKAFSANGKTYYRLTHDCGNIINPTRQALFDDIYQKYGYDPSPQNNTARKGSALLKKMMTENNISVNSHSYTITRLIRLHILLSGFLYSLRNRTMHGDSLSTTKSSKTNLRRYALNYYAFLSQYCFCILMLTDQSGIPNKADKYNEIAREMETNIENMKSLFGNNMG